MSKKTPNPLIPIAEVLGQDVGEILGILRRIEENVRPKVDNEPVIPSMPTNSLLPETGFIHYRSGYSNPDKVFIEDEVVVDYKIPVPKEFEGKTGLMLLKTQGSSWHLAYNGILESHKVAHRSAERCEVMLILTNRQTDFIVSEELVYE